MSNKTQLHKLAYWINEREAIRDKKERGADKPWTTDPILRDYRFCNVHREDDFVTRWIATNWRTPNKQSPHIWHGMLVARYINWPATMNEMGWPEPWVDKKREVRKVLQRRQMRGEKIFTGAYIVSTNGARMDKVSFILEMFDESWKVLQKGLKCSTLEEAYRILLDIKGVGTFMAGQIIADVKHTDALKTAEDWWHWCSPGPGSKRGLTRVIGTHINNDKEFIKRLHVVRAELAPMIPNIKLDLQDMQNCLCEFDKYCRGSSRSLYAGA